MATNTEYFHKIIVDTALELVKITIVERDLCRFYSCFSGRELPPVQLFYWFISASKCNKSLGFNQANLG